ncbi:MAG: hypothetical protein IJX39_00860 [Clostridia bacterium]|nr:hypothetical protein [Clostridia bacterium]
MATIFNKGTLRFTPQCGAQMSIDSNTTGTDLEVTYGLEVSHGASPLTYTDGDTLVYTVVLRNTGSGTLVLPTVTVDIGDDALDVVEGSAVAFLYDGEQVTPYPFTVSADGVIFTFADPIPAGALVFLTYRATVTASAGDSILSTAVGTAHEGVATGPAISDRDAVTVTRAPLTIVKSAPATAEVGDTIRFCFTVTNHTRSPVALDRLTDQLPDQFSLTAVTFRSNGNEVTLNEGCDYTLENGLLTVDPARSFSLPAGDTVILTVVGVITA